MAITLLLAMNAYAQNIAVQSFVLDETDVTANLQGTTVLDQNGEKCALIRIFTTATGFTFDVGALVVQKVEQKTGEIWVYVPHGVKRISMNHAQLGHCDYTFPMPIQRARTYKMELIAGQVQTTVKRAVTSQYVLFQLSPANAVVEIDNKMLQTVDGTATRRLPFGSYSYRVQAPNYYPQVGTVIVNNPQNKHVVNIKLEPAFASVILKTIQGADIYVDGQKKGTGTWSGTLGYGIYQVECRKSGYRSSQQEITISKEDVNHMINLPKPIPIYGTLDINSAPANADVFLDNKKIGTTPMIMDNCIIGTYNLKISRSGYTDYNEAIKLTEGETLAKSVELKKLALKYVPSRYSSNDDEVLKAKEIIRQKKDSPIGGNDKVFDVVEQMPSFPGGMAALMQFLASNIKYPVEAENNGIQGRVVCTFTIERDGSISDVRVTRPVEPSLDSEAVRVLKTMPPWNPGKNNGQTVRVKYTLPVTFRLQ